MMQQYGRRPNRTPARRSGAGAPSQVFCAAKSWRRGNSLAPGMFDPLGVVRAWGLEPQRRKAREPKSRMSANFIMPAWQCYSTTAPRREQAENCSPLFEGCGDEETAHFFILSCVCITNGRPMVQNHVSPAFLIRFRRTAALPRAASFFRRTSASRCRTRRGWSGAASE